MEFDKDKAHWLKVLDWAEENINQLKEKIKEFEETKREAEEEFFSDVPEDWRYIKVDGRVVFSRESKVGQKRVYIEDLKVKYPEIYEELKRQKPSESVKRIK